MPDTPQTQDAAVKEILDRREGDPSAALFVAKQKWMQLELKMHLMRFLDNAHSASSMSLSRSRGDEPAGKKAKTSSPSPPEQHVYTESGNLKWEIQVQPDQKQTQEDAITELENVWKESFSHPLIKPKEDRTVRVSDRVSISPVKFGRFNECEDSESEPESQPLTVSQAADFEPTTKEGDKRKPGHHFNFITVEKALTYLVKNRKDSKEDKFENDYTQWVVNRLISDAMPTLKKQAQKHKSTFSPLVGGAMEDCIELGHYAEKDHTYKNNTTRRPDSLLYLGGKDDTATRLTKEMQRIGALVALEHKKSISDNGLFRKAVFEIQRDHAEKVQPADFLHSPAFHGVVTDGIEWTFLELKLIQTRSAGKMAFSTEIMESERVSIWDGKEFNFRALADWLVYILRQSLTVKETRILNNRGIEQKTELKLGSHTMKVSKCLDVGRYYIAKASSFSNPSEHLVLKSPIPVDDDDKEVRRFVIEKKNLDLFASCTTIVNRARGFDDVVDFLVLEDAGIGLDQLVTGGQAGKELATIVYRDIWVSALEALKEKKICHADIHPGNIAVSTGRDGKYKATLLDLESAKGFGENLDDSPIKYHNLTSKVANHSLDQMSLVAILECLWYKGSFEGIEQKIGEQNTGDATSVIPVIEEIKKALQAAFSNRAKQKIKYSIITSPGK